MRYKTDIGTAMRRFAEANGAEFRDALPADELPQCVSLFRRGERQRCTNAIALKLDRRLCLLFRFECYYGDRGGWHEYRVAWVPAGLPGIADFQVRSRFSHRGPLICVAVVSLLIAASSLASVAATGSWAACVSGLVLSTCFLFMGSMVVVFARWRSHPNRSPDILDEQTLDFFSRRGLSAECAEANLVVWYERTLEQLYRTEWNRSFRSIDDWMSEELQGLLDAVRQVCSRADLRKGQ